LVVFSVQFFFLLWGWQLLTGRVVVAAYVILAAVWVFFGMLYKSRLRQWLDALLPVDHPWKTALILISFWSLFLLAGLLKRWLGKRER